jgi:hypothetical protein
MYNVRTGVKLSPTWRTIIAACPRNNRLFWEPRVLQLPSKPVDFMFGYVDLEG